MNKTKQQFKTIGLAVLFILLVILLMVAGQVAGQMVGMIMALLNVFIDNPGNSVDKLITQPNFILIATTLGEIFSVLLVWIFASLIFKVKLPKINKHTGLALLIGIPSMLFILFNSLSYGVTIHKNGFSLKNLIYGLIIGLSIGIFEEYANRGALISLLIKKQSAPSYRLIGILSGSLFGLFHLVNLSNGDDVLATLLQVMYASGLGIIFAAIYLRTQNLVVPIVIHGLIDAIAWAAAPTQNLSNGSESPEIGAWIIFGTITLIFFTSAMIALRPAKKKELDALWNK